MPTPLEVLEGLAIAAKAIKEAKAIFDDPHERLEEAINEVLTSLQALRNELVSGIQDILEAIEGIRRQIDEDVALNNMVLADRALFNDLAIFNDKQQAMGNSFEAADRLFREEDPVFAMSFIYVVNIRLAVLKDFDANYFCNEQFQTEFTNYRRHLRRWIAQIRDLINRSHTVEVERTIQTDIGVINESGNSSSLINLYWRGTHYRNGVRVQFFLAPFEDPASRANVEYAANNSRAAGIATDIVRFGIPEMEQTVETWAEAFVTSRRLALIKQVLNRDTLATDFNPAGFMIDGRVIPNTLDFKSILYEVLKSREFKYRIEKSWDAFLNRSDDRLVKFAVHRLFNRNAEHEEVDQLRRLALRYGYAAFIATLLNSEEYVNRFGNGLPNAGPSIVQSLDSW